MSIFKEAVEAFRVQRVSSSSGPQGGWGSPLHCSTTSLPIWGLTAVFFFFSLSTGLNSGPARTRGPRTVSRIKTAHSGQVTRTGAPRLRRVGRTPVSARSTSGVVVQPRRHGGGRQWPASSRKGRGHGWGLRRRTLSAGQHGGRSPSRQ